MSNVHAKVFQLYNKDHISATAYSSGGSHSVQLRYGATILAERPTLKECMTHAYIGVRLKSPKFHDWLSTNALRFAILRDLVEMDELIDGKIFHESNSTLMTTLKQGMRWGLDNKLEVNLDPKLENPFEVIERLQEEFFKGTRLMVHIKLQSNPKLIIGDDDEFDVSLMEDKKTKETYMVVAENNLHHSCFNKEWIDNAKNSFNAYRRASAPVQPGINPAMYHPLAPLHPGIQNPAQQPGLGISPYTNKPFNHGTGTPAQFKLYGKTGDVDVTLQGSTVSLIASGDVTLETPQINVTGGMDGFTPKLNLGELAFPHVTAFGKSVFDMDDRLVAQVDIRSVKAYNESPYFNQEVQMPIPFQEFIETKLRWSWMDTTFEDYLLKGYKSDDQGRDPQVVAFINIASRLCNVLIA